MASRNISITLPRIFLQAHVKNLGATPTKTQKLDIAKRRERLLSQIIAFQEVSETFLAVLNINISQPEIVDEDWSDDETDNKGADELFDLSAAAAQHLSVGQVENISLFLPSTFGYEQCAEANLRNVINKEIQLREGQANDCLHHLRLAIGQKSFLFRTQLRNAHSKKRKTKAWDDISSVSDTVSHHQRVYHLARDASISLWVTLQITDKYQVIHSRDI